MKRMIVIAACLISSISYAQTETTKLYHPEADAKKDIKAAIKQAKAENKFVLIQGGGNWCTWCYEFVRFCKADPKIDSALNAGFVWYHLNTSKENKNEATFAKYGFPQRFGFPVFIILDQKGNRIHTQNSVYFEDGKKSYERNRVLEFLQMWSPKALDPAQYAGQ